MPCKICERFSVEMCDMIFIIYVEKIVYLRVGLKMNNKND